MHKNRKPRTATDRHWNKWLANHDNSPRCPYFEGVTKTGRAVTECLCPWESKCMGNVFECGKLRYQYLAGSINKEKDRK